MCIRDRVRAHLRAGDSQHWVADVGKKAYAQDPFSAGEQRWMDVLGSDVKVLA